MCRLRRLEYRMPGPQSSGPARLMFLRPDYWCQFDIALFIRSWDWCIHILTSFVARAELVRQRASEH